MHAGFVGSKRLKSSERNSHGSAKHIFELFFFFLYETGYGFSQDLEEAGWRGSPDSKHFDNRLSMSGAGSV